MLSYSKHICFANSINYFCTFFAMLSIPSTVSSSFANYTPYSDQWKVPTWSAVWWPRTGNPFSWWMDCLWPHFFRGGNDRQQSALSANEPLIRKAKRCGWIDPSGKYTPSGKINFPKLISRLCRCPCLGPVAQQAMKFNEIETPRSFRFVT